MLRPKLVGSWEAKAHPLPCAEQRRLLELLVQAESKYGDLVFELTVRAGTLKRNAYRMGRTAAQMARQTAEDFREALSKHREEHGC